MGIMYTLDVLVSQDSNGKEDRQISTKTSKNTAWKADDFYKTVLKQSKADP